MSYWEGRRAAAVDELFQTGADHAADWAARRAQKKADAQYQADYAAAVEAAKKNGTRLDDRFQRSIAEDDAVDTAGIKAVLLRELAKVAPDHPMVKSRDCRVAVADVTRIKFNRAGRPTDQYFDDFAPEDTELDRIFEHYSP